MKKLTRDEAIKIIRSFLKERLSTFDWYPKVRRYLKAIIFYGSTSKGTNRADSDIDLLFILPLKIEEKYTKGEYFYTCKGREINIVMRSIEKLRKLAKAKNDAFQAEVFRRAKVIWEKDKEAGTLIKKITSSKC